MTTMENMINLGLVMFGLVLAAALTFDLLMVY